MAILSYSAFGFLSPVGKLLLDFMGPFTLNALRTLFSLPFLFLLFGPKTSAAALRSVAREPSVWLLGGGFLTLTLLPYLWSLKYLPATITTLTVYLSPLLVAAWSRFVMKERVSWMVIPAVVLTLGGGYLAIAGPGGITLDRQGLWGLFLATVGVLGWTAYTIHLKWLSRTHDANQLTLAAFLTSAVAFTVGAYAFESFRTVWTSTTLEYLALYVLLPGVVSFWLYAQSLRYASTTTVAVLIGVELVATALISRAMTGEGFALSKILGLALVLGAVTAYLATEVWRERKLPVRTQMFH